MEKKHLASIKNFLASASVAAVEAESCEVMLAKVQREKPLSRLPVATNFGNDGKQLKLLKQKQHQEKLRRQMRRPQQNQKGLRRRRTTCWAAQ